MTYEFEYIKAIDKCEMLSSFEGRDLVGDSGESLYLKIKITEQDRPLIRTYLEQAARVLEEGMAKIITSSAYSEKGSYGRSGRRIHVGMSTGNWTRTCWTLW